MIYTVIILIFISTFCLLHSTNGVKKVLWLYIAFFILLGGLKEKYSYFLEPADWFTLIILTSLFLYGLFQKRKYIFEINWPDILLLFYFTFTLYVPMIIHLQKASLNPYNYFIFFMPMRIWFVYRIFFYAMSEASCRKEENVNFDYIINAMLFIGSISALIAMLRYFPIPYIQDFIENTWPIITNGRHVSIEYWKRLWGTSGGTNTTGNVFGILLLFSLYRTKLDKKFMVFSSVFFICVLLSGSFSTMAGLIIVLVFFFREYVSKKLIITVMAVILLGLVLIYKVPVLSDTIGTRFAKKFYTQSEFHIMPDNLQSRLGYWQFHLNTLFNEYNGIFGFGPGGMRNTHSSYASSYSFHGNPESFYFRLLGDSGFVGLLAFIIMIWIIFKRIRLLMINGRYKEEALIMGFVIMFYVLAGVANQTLYYGACTEIFGIILCFIYLMGKSVSYSPMSTFKRHDHVYTTY